jgi:hypothetical protein
MKHYIGEVNDNRKQSLKDKDYSLDELDFGSQDYLTKKEADKAKGKLTNRDQKNTSQCLCFSTCTVLENTEGEVLSPVYLYTQRANKPQEGCMYWNIGDIVVNQGVAPEKDLITPAKEAEANAVKITPELKKVAEPFRQKAYLIKNNPTIDKIKDIVNSGDALVGSIFATSKEWSQEYPEVIDKDLIVDNAPIRHAIAILPNSAFIYKKKKYIIIQDSAKFGKITFRYLSEDFIKARLRVIQDYIDLDYVEPIKWITPPNLKGYKFTRDLTIGDRGDDVYALQVLLQENGLFPANQEPTGAFYGITRQAVKDFQEKFKTDILIAIGLKSGTGFFGKSSRAKLEDLIK